MLALLGLIPGVMTLISSVTTAVFNAKVQIYQAKTGADRDVAVAAVQAASVAEHENTSRLAIIANNKLLTFMLIAFSVPLIVYEWQIIVHDIIWCNWVGKNCSTDPIRGQVADWANTIIGFIFGTSGALALGKMWLSRKE